MRNRFFSLTMVLFTVVSIILPNVSIVQAAETYNSAYTLLSSQSYTAYNTDIYKNGIDFASNTENGFMYSEGAWVSYSVDFSDTGSDTLMMNMRPNVKNTQGTIGIYADSMDTEPIAVFDQAVNIPYGGYTSYAGPGYKDYYFSLSRQLFGKHTIYFKAISNACTYFKNFKFISSEKNITDCYAKIKPSDNPDRVWGTGKGVATEDDGDGETSVLQDVRGCVYIPGVDFGNDPDLGAQSVTVRYARWYKTTENNGEYEVRLDGIDGEVIGTLMRDDVTYGAYGTYNISFNRVISGVHTIVFAMPDITTVSYVQFNRGNSLQFSWIGNSYSGKENENGMKEFMLHDIASIYVSPETGKMYTNVFWSEGGSNFSEITNGELTNIGYGSHGWGYEGGYAVTANSKYVYFGQSAVNKGKNDGNWPEEGYAWFGVTRRLVSDITTGDSFSSMKMANGGSSGRYFLPIDTIPISEDEADGTVTNGSECVISGLAATDTELFVSDAFYEKIKVYDASTMQYLREWDCPAPGQLTLDSYGNLWVVQPSEKQILCFSTDGNPLRVISVANSIELWSIAATVDGRLLIPDRGIKENIMVYGSLNKNRPVLEGYIGAEGGIFSGTGSEIGAIGNERFYGISGIGTDCENNIYVCNSGVFVPDESNSFGTAFIESYSADHTLRWRLYGLEFLDSAVVDPDNPTNVYTKFEHFSMDYSKEPGQEQSYVGYTVNPRKYPEDFRITNNSIHPIAVRNVDGVKLMFATDMYGYSLYVYRFNPETDGEVAIPCMAIYDDTKARQVILMQDTTGDGCCDTNTVLHSDETKYVHVWLGWNVDKYGNIFNALNYDRTIVEYTYGGINENGVPVWEHNPEKKYSTPELFNGKSVDGFNSNQYSDLRMCHYDAENDVMYLTAAFDNYNYNDGNGSVPMYSQSKSPGDTLARVENWSKGNRETDYIINFDYSKKLYQNKYLNVVSGFAVCEDYIFVCESAFTEMGAIHIYEAQTGNWVQDIPYNGYFGENGLLDIVMPLSAAKIASDKYMILLEDDLCSKILTIYWQPPAELQFSRTDFSGTEASGEVKLTVERTGSGNKGVNAYFALYDGDELSELILVKKEKEELILKQPITLSAKFSSLKQGQEIKVMVWDDFQRPLRIIDNYYVTGNE